MTSSRAVRARPATLSRQHTDVFLQCLRPAQGDVTVPLAVYVFFLRVLFGSDEFKDLSSFFRSRGCASENFPLDFCPRQVLFSSSQCEALQVLCWYFHLMSVCVVPASGLRSDIVCAQSCFIRTDSSASNSFLWLSVFQGQ